MNTKDIRRKLTAAIGAATACATLICGGVGAAQAMERDALGGSVLNAYNALNGNGMRFEKVSHPQGGLRAPDGVVDYIGDGMIVHAANTRRGIVINSWNYMTPVKIVNVLGN